MKVVGSQVSELRGEVLSRDCAAGLGDRHGASPNRGQYLALQSSTVVPASVVSW
jgi:hypothetical protein